MSLKIAPGLAGGGLNEERGGNSLEVTDSSASKAMDNSSTDYPHSKSERISLEESLYGCKDILDIREKKRKGVSFLSRIIGNRSKNLHLHPPKPFFTGIPDIAEHGDDSESVYRPEGMDACPFSGQRVPQYIKVRAKNKTTRDLSHLFVAQRLLEANPIANEARAKAEGTPGQVGAADSARDVRRREHEPTLSAIWALELSNDGRYLAAGSQDGTVRVWEVISHAAERQSCTTDQVVAPVFKPTPIRVFQGSHTSTVLDLSWSKNNFLISSSSDKTVRLWHMSRQGCLCMFRHSEMIPSVCFHPTDDRFFLAGSLDAKVRLWSIPDRKVAFWAHLPGMITAVGFSPDGSKSVIGTATGTCVVFETKGMVEVLRIVVRSSRGKNSRGSRITSIATQWADETHEENGSKHLEGTEETQEQSFDMLIASNDSRIRLYRMRLASAGWTIGLEKKFKGHAGSETQMRASFGEGGRYIVSGSEDKRTFVWQLGSGEGQSCIASTGERAVAESSPSGTNPTSSVGRGREPVAQSLEYRKHPVETVESNSSRTTAALLAPASTRALLARSRDPVYELCRRCAELEVGSGGTLPTPVSGSMAGTGLDIGEFVDSDNHSGHDQSLDQSIDQSIHDRSAHEAFPDMESSLVHDEHQHHPQANAGAIDDTHPGGHILICADASGSIVVFRQDCAHFRRPTLLSALAGLPCSMSDIFSAHTQTGSYAGSVMGRSSLFRGRVPSIRSYFSARYNKDGGLDEGSTLSAPIPAVAGLRNQFGRTSSMRHTIGGGSGSGISTGRSTPIMGIGHRNSYRAPRQSQSLQNLRPDIAAATVPAGSPQVTATTTGTVKTNRSMSYNILNGADSAGNIRDSIVHKTDKGSADADRDGRGSGESDEVQANLENIVPLSSRSSPGPDTVKSGLYPAWTLGRPTVGRDRITFWSSEVGGIK